MLPIRTILHPTDFSDQAQYAFHLACALARDYGAHLVVMHVVPFPQIAGGEIGYVIPAEPIPMEELREQLRELRPADGSVSIEHLLAEGDVPYEILRTAAKCKCDLIVMGTHGRTGLSRLVMGSVAEAVQRKAPCPVLTVKAPILETELLTGEPVPATAGA